MKLEILRGELERTHMEAEQHATKQSVNGEIKDKIKNTLYK